MDGRARLRELLLGLPFVGLLFFPLLPLGTKRSSNLTLGFATSRSEPYFLLPAFFNR
jgi:hypothetical protein